MSIMNKDGTRYEADRWRWLIDAVQERPHIIGYRRWGMIQLYYRAGLSQREIGAIFGVNRQIVGYEIRRAFRLIRRSVRVEKPRGERPVTHSE